MVLMLRLNASRIGFEYINKEVGTDAAPYAITNESIIQYWAEKARAERNEIKRQCALRTGKTFCSLARKMGVTR